MIKVELNFDKICEVINGQNLNNDSIIINYSTEKTNENISHKYEGGVFSTKIIICIPDNLLNNSLLELIKQYVIKNSKVILNEMDKKIKMLHELIKRTQEEL